MVDFGEVVFDPKSEILAKKYFELKNYSKETFRFQWSLIKGKETTEFIKIFPERGHLAGLMSKKIKVYLYSTTK